VKKAVFFGVFVAKWFTGFHFASMLAKGGKWFRSTGIDTAIL